MSYFIHLYGAEYRHRIQCSITLGDSRCTLSQFSIICIMLQEGHLTFLPVYCTMYCNVSSHPLYNCCPVLFYVTFLVIKAEDSLSLRALKTVDDLAQKIEFDGPSVNITSRNLILGILAFNTSTFNGASFTAFRPPNSTEPQVTWADLLHLQRNSSVT